MDRNPLSNAPLTAPLTVSQLAAAIKQRLEGGFSTLVVQGEISNFKQQSSGHCYFCLKDSEAQIQAVLFRGARMLLDRLPKDGDQVVAIGEVSLYTPRSQVQIVVRSLRLVGLGELLIRLEELKKKLQALGWFAPDRKRPLPAFPKRIGVVTSPTGAAIQDILKVLTKRHSGFNLLLNPVRVQGREAAAEIAAAIEQFNAHNMVDVMIVGRGGGSIEDLWPFNEEVVARAIFESRIPVVSAVGHETDWCIADLVADVRAPTPSAAATLVIAEKAAQEDRLQRYSQTLTRTLRHLLAHAKQRLHRYETHPIFASPYQLLGKAMQQCDDMKLELTRSMRHLLSMRRLALTSVSRQIALLQPTRRLHEYRLRLAQTQATLDLQIKNRLAKARTALSHIAEHLASLNPSNLVRKGYSILLAEKEERVITSIRSLGVGQRVKALLADGTALLEVQETHLAS